MRDERLRNGHGPGDADERGLTGDDGRAGQRGQQAHGQHGAVRERVGEQAGHQGVAVFHGEDAQEEHSDRRDDVQEPRESAAARILGETLP